MAVPKRKTSQQRKHTRSANWKLTVPTLVECPQCHEKILSHRVCQYCGFYKGQEVVKQKTKSEN